MFADLAYAPFGEPYTTAGNSSDREFTNQREDTVQTFYNFQFREYNVTQGRWISPDPAGLSAVDAMNPQSWNRYSYVQNAPLTSTDPLGLFCTGVTLDNGFCYHSGNSFGSDWNEFTLLELAFTPTKGYVVPDPEFPWSDNSKLFLVYGNIGLLNLLNRDNFTVTVTATEPPANNGTPQTPTKTHCLGQALKQNGNSFTLDVVGAIPGFGNLVHAGAATGRIIDGLVAYGGGAYGVATGLKDESPVGAASTGLGLGLTLAGTALGEGAKAIPIAGNALSVLTGAYDAYQGYKTYQQCMAGGG